MIYSNLNRTGQIKEIKVKNNKEILEIYGGIGENNPIYYKETSLEGIAPLSFKALGQPITDWSIAGAQGGVGDRTGNLFDGNFLQGYWAIADGAFISANNWVCSSKLPCTPNTTYTSKFSTLSRWYGYIWFDIDGNYIGSTLSQESATPTSPIIFTATSPSNAAYFGFDIAGATWNTLIHPEDVTDLMIVEGSTALPYEPYGYKIPIVCGGETTNFYLDNPLDENDSISFLETHQQISTIAGQNTISINTAVQPSKIVIKGNIKTQL